MDFSTIKVLFSQIVYTMSCEKHLNVALWVQDLFLLKLNEHVSYSYSRSISMKNYCYQILDWNKCSRKVHTNSWTHFLQDFYPDKSFSYKKNVLWHRYFKFHICWNHSGISFAIGSHMHLVEIMNILKENHFTTNRISYPWMLCIFFKPICWLNMSYTWQYVTIGQT